MQVGVVGVGSIGSVLARGFDQLGHTVTVNDENPQRTHELPFEARTKHWMANNCDVVVFAVPTPTTAQGGDASIVAEAVEPFRGGDAVCLIRSTMPPGETHRISDAMDIPLVYSPEFLRDRSGVGDFFHPDRIVISGPEEQRAAVRELMDDDAIDCDCIIELDDYLTAEIGKEAHNAFFATKVSFANQVRMICERQGADPQTAMDIVTADSRNTTSHLDPMLGPYGGKCLPKDTGALQKYGQQYGARTPLLDGVVETNELAKKEYDNVEISGNYPNIQTAD